MSTPFSFVTGSQATVRLFAFTSSPFVGLVTAYSGITWVSRSEPTIFRPSTLRPLNVYLPAGKRS